MSSSSASPADLADAIRRQAVQAGAETPAVRGADWRLATVATVNTDGTIITTDGITARRLETYRAPAVNDVIVVTVSGNGNWIAAGRMATTLDTVGTKLFARKTANTARNTTTTLADDPHLTVTVTANAVYELALTLFWTGPNAGGIKGAFAVPSGTAGRWSLYGPDVSMTAGGNTAQVRADSVGSLTTALPAGSSDTSHAMTAQPTGLVVVGGTGGSFTFQWAQNTSNASDTTLFTHSWMSLIRVA
ncbi:hypothetical protein [Streptomyces albireticuli]|uniref:Uncharacterized protein n=1 Tax=Streptomyces albireticuli TaxID=1940 RepID=A0A2A2D3S9_9ACTN|nr:hypothetical protein [Streptomyces albireticuli]MCD9196083.1 hypothetical protein [Streptomyces albireticuli]PAU46165.1 hypothetical protein CK936_25550 [Streptomyces albireticuli]